MLPLLNSKEDVVPSDSSGSFSSPHTHACSLPSMHALRKVVAASGTYTPA